MTQRLRVAVHKFSSCDGCQLALLSLGEALLELASSIEFVHFAEAGVVDEQAYADVSLVEGSISSRADVERIREVRRRSEWLVAIGACATGGGLQALRNAGLAEAWVRAIYPMPEYLDVTPQARRIGEYVRIDGELHGCPVNSQQVVQLLEDRLRGVPARQERQPLCLECKRQGHACVVVTKAEPCLGPVTNAGCGALCPAHGRPCYGCYGPVELANVQGLMARFAEAPADGKAITRRLAMLHTDAPHTTLKGGPRSATSAPTTGRARDDDAK